MLKRILAGAAALLVIAGTGCSSSDGEKTKDLGADVSKGRYVEEDLDTDGIWNVGEFANGEDICFADISYNEGGKTGRIHRLAEDGFTAEDINCTSDGQSWQMYQGTVSADGVIFASCFDDEGNFDNCLITKDGECRKMGLCENDMLLSYEFSADGRLFAINMERELVEINKDTLEMTKLCSFDEGVNALDIAGDRIYCSCADSIKVYDLSTGSTAETDTALADLWKQVIAEGGGCYDIFSGLENDIYIVCQNGIYRHTEGGSVIEQVVDGMLNSLGGEDDSAVFGAVDKDGSFVISFMNGELRRYYYDPNAVNEFTSELNIYTLENSRTVSQTARTFSKKHPEIKLNIEVGMKDGVTYEDAVKNLTTEIMSGKAPDIIMLDGLDTGNFEDKGVLADLSEIREKWSPDDELYSNISEYNSDGGLYSVACRYAIPVVMGKKDGLSNIKGYGDLTKKTVESYTEKGGVSNEEEYEPESFSNEYMGFITQLYANKMIRDGKPDEAVIKEFLESTKLLISKPCYGVQFFVDEYDDNRAMDDAIQVGTSLTDYASDLCSSVETLNTVTSIRDERSDADTVFGVEDNPNVFRPLCEMGICASSEHKDEAAEFIKTMLSGEVQQTKTDEGLPVNKASLEKMLSEYDSANMVLSAMIVDDNGVERNFNVHSTDEAERAALDAYISSADTPVRCDKQTENAVTEAGVSCLNGDISVDEAVEKIKTELELKMKE